jgi:hypothetical protein
MEAWVGCVAGALEIDTYRVLLMEAGFRDVSVEITRRYTAADAGLDTATLPAGWEEADGKVAGAFVRATKPLSAAAPAPPVPEAARGEEVARRGEEVARRGEEVAPEAPVAAHGACCGGSCCN